MPFRRFTRLVLCALAICAAPSHAGPDSRFNEAAASYRAARYSEAFGRMMALAANGDPDAARIVLFMHQYGPVLYGNYWDLNNEELFAFQELAILAKARPAPPFRPMREPVRPGSAKARNAAQARGK